MSAQITRKATTMNRMLPLLTAAAGWLLAAAAQAAAPGNPSILFPGFNVSASGVQGLLTSEAAPGSTATYTFTASSPGTRAYYSGTQGDLQVEMGLYGAIIVLPANVPAVCASGLPTTN